MSPADISAGQLAPYLQDPARSWRQWLVALRDTRVVAVRLLRSARAREQGMTAPEPERATGCESVFLRVLMIGADADLECNRPAAA